MAAGDPSVQIHLCHGDTTSLMAQGNQLAQSASFVAIKGGEVVSQVADTMGEISAASTEQSAGVSQVGEAVTLMDQATQQNAALVEESAAAAESLEAQAQQLVTAVVVFKLSSEAPVTAATTGPVFESKQAIHSASQQRAPHDE